jgi:hypothetical protein
MSFPPKKTAYPNKDHLLPERRDQWVCVASIIHGDGFQILTTLVGNFTYGVMMSAHYMQTKKSARRLQA